MPRSLCEAVWQAIEYTDRTPEQDFVEVLFGVGPPWDGETHLETTYYLTSIRNDRLVLVSQNPCRLFCTTFFPHCYRVGRENLCGQRYERSRDGVRAALRDVVRVHEHSPTSERPMWAVLVLYDANARGRRVKTWEDIEHPSVKCAAPESSASGLARWWEAYNTVCWAAVGFVALAMVLLVMSVVTRRKSPSDYTSDDEGGANGGKSSASKSNDINSIANSINNSIR